MAKKLNGFIEYLFAKIDAKKDNRLQKEMGLIRSELEEGLMTTYQGGQMTTKVHIYPTFDEGAEEVRETLVNEDGIFQKINYRSNIYEGQAYSILYRDGQFIFMSIEDNDIKQLIINDKGVYRETTVKDMIADGSKVYPDNLYNIIEMMADMASLTKREEMSE